MIRDAAGTRREIWDDAMVGAGLAIAPKVPASPSRDNRSELKLLFCLFF